MHNEAACISNYRGGADANSIPSLQLWRGRVGLLWRGTDGSWAVWSPLGAGVKWLSYPCSHVVAANIGSVICYVWLDLSGFYLLDEVGH